MRTTRLLKAALGYFEAQQPVIAVGDDKRPYRKGWNAYFTRQQTEEEVREQFSNGAWGIAKVLHPASIYVHLDYDGEHAEAAWLKTKVILPGTARMRTPSGGFHLIFKASDLLKNTPALKRDVRIVEADCDCKKSCGVDFLINGYAVIPPSPGYVEEVSLERAVGLPDEVVRLAIARRKQERDLRLTGKIPEGKRDVTLLKIGGRHRRQGLEYEELVKVLCRENEARCKPPLELAAVEKIARSLCKYEPAEPKQKHDDDVPTDVFTSVDTIATVKVSWLWEGWVPIGYLTHVGGDPGVGKSFLCLKIAAAVSRGEMLPGNSKSLTPSYVILLSMEDGIADTIRPRLESMGADLTKIQVIDPKKNISPSQIDMGLIEEQVKLVGPLLVVLDPIIYFAGGRDINQAAQVRELLSPYAALAGRYSFAGIVAGHLNKQSSAKALYRASGSVDFSAVCRSFMVLDEDPEDPARRIIAQPKVNLGLKRQSLSFAISAERGIEFGEEVDISANDLLGKEETRGRESRKLESAKLLLEEVLGNGPRAESEAEDRSREAGISKATLWRAKKDLGVESRKEGFSAWWWRLPGGGEWPWE